MRLIVSNNHSPHLTTDTNRNRVKVIIWVAFGDRLIEVTTIPCLSARTIHANVAYTFSPKNLIPVFSYLVKAIFRKE
jgi:hypothetical protein